MSDIDLAVKRSKRLEHLLEQNLGATGKGLHEKIGSVETKLPAELVRNIRLVATVRNKLVHEDDYTKIADRHAFVRAGDAAEKQLRAMGKKGGGKGFIVIVVFAIILALLFLLFKLGRL